MEITITVITLVIGLIAMLCTTVITFYVKDNLQQKLEYQQLGKNPEEIAGRNERYSFVQVPVDLKKKKVTEND